MPRALAFEHRFAAAIADGGVVDVLRSGPQNLPHPLRKAYSTYARFTQAEGRELPLPAGARAHRAAHVRLDGRADPLIAMSAPSKVAQQASSCATATPRSSGGRATSAPPRATAGQRRPARPRPAGAHLRPRRPWPRRCCRGSRRAGETSAPTPNWTAPSRAAAVPAASPWRASARAGAFGNANPTANSTPNIGTSTPTIPPTPFAAAASRTSPATDPPISAPGAASLARTHAAGRR